MQQVVMAATEENNNNAIENLSINWRSQSEHELFLSHVVVTTSQH
jgi:hypothetical protein